MVYTYTDELGIYQFDGLNDDAYYVSFADLSGRYATQFYGSAADPFVAEAITISGGQHVSGINGVLQLGGSIAGQVMGPDAKPLADVQVYVYRTEPSLSQLYLPVPVMTDSSGFYVIHGLNSGVYRVCFEDTTHGLPFRCYGSISSADNGRDILVEAGNRTDNINIILGTPDLLHKFYLPTTLHDATVLP